MFILVQANIIFTLENIKKETMSTLVPLTGMVKINISWDVKGRTYDRLSMIATLVLDKIAPQFPVKDQEILYQNFTGQMAQAFKQGFICQKFYKILCKIYKHLHEAFCLANTKRLSNQRPTSPAICENMMGYFHSCR